MGHTNIHYWGREDTSPFYWILEYHHPILSPFGNLLPYQCPACHILKTFTAKGKISNPKDKDIIFVCKTKNCSEMWRIEKMSVEKKRWSINGDITREQWFVKTVELS